MDQLIAIPSMFAKYGGNLVRNTGNAFALMDIKGYIRMIAIVGAYLLIRPYLLKFGAKVQAKQHEKEIDTAEILGAKAKISPNMIRGHNGKKVEIEESDSEEEGETTGVQWGKKARKRQRTITKKLLDELERKAEEMQADDEDKDIEEYLVDYEPGKDGW